MAQWGCNMLTWCLLILISAVEGWQEWLTGFGHDSWRYPTWISEQVHSCSCQLVGETIVCNRDHDIVDWRFATEFSWCEAKHFLLTHMPAFDLEFLPASVSVEGTSMLDDNIAFALMAWNASSVTPRPPLRVAFAYLLPYATYHESRANWRPLFFCQILCLC